mmetsp:Transcript_96756/g.257136  ORF Transcript_96756/g.257136 Transcript_96756/m.257136 type:complete len:249 (-) Transcript_96756:54-800(-)
MGRVVHLVHVRVVGQHVLGQVDATLRGQARGCTLAEVHRSIAPVRRPGVGRAVGVHVQGAVGVLVDPAGEGAVLVDVARPLAAAQRDAKEAALADHLTASNGRDLAVVDDLNWHAAKLVLRDVVEDRHDLLPVDVRGHVGEAVAPSGLAPVGDCACRAAADGNDFARQLGSHLLHGLDNEVVVVLRVWVGDVPLRLLRINDLAVVDCNSLDIALPEVKGDARTIGNLPRHHGHLLLLWELGGAAHDDH